MNDIVYLPTSGKITALSTDGDIVEDGDGDTTAAVGSGDGIGGENLFYRGQDYSSSSDHSVYQTPGISMTDFTLNEIAPDPPNATIRFLVCYTLSGTSEKTAYARLVQTGTSNAITGSEVSVSLSVTGTDYVCSTIVAEASGTGGIQSGSAYDVQIKCSDNTQVNIHSVTITKIYSGA
jgi:hypothetical protein